MGLPSWLRFTTSASPRARFLSRHRQGRPPRALLRVEQLETRITPYALSTLASLNSIAGANPIAGLVMDSSGNLYGTTTGGGTSGYGTVFEVAQGSGTITTLASFNGTNGRQPYNSLILDGSGNLYGTTRIGGASNDGVVFEVAHGSGTITTIASFNGTNGANPIGALVVDGSGNLYGTTNAGGASGDGTVFELAPGSGTITTLASFNGTNGKNPSGGLLIDGTGNLYGVTSWGGASSVGVVYELAQGSGTIAPLASFSGFGDPHGTLVLDGSGNLYGTTSAVEVLFGDILSYGTLFELAHGSSTIATLATFNGTNGTDPLGSLVLDGSGNQYGATYQGGAANDGTVFELPAGSSTIATLASFNGTNGAEPNGGVILDGSGNLDGTTDVGGASGDGTVFELVNNGIALSPTTIPPATVGAAYSQTLSAVAGTAPYTFAVTAGSLPAGLTLSSAGVLSGTPTAAGSSSFTVTATDSTGATGSQAYTLTAYPASFSVTGFPAPITAGGTGTITVTALDSNGNVVPSYTGTVHFTSSDRQAVLPADYTFTAADQGTHTFTATLKTAGTQSITAADTTNGSVTGGDTGISVNPAATAALVFTGGPANGSIITAGTTFTEQLTAEDAYGNTTPGYTGTIHFTSSDPQAVLPANYTFTSSDAGQHAFSITLKTAGTQSVTATDTVTSSFTATAGGIIVVPAAAARFVLTAPATVTHATAFNLTLTVYDAYGNVATGYTGTVHFSSSDSTATLPANYSFTAADAGAHTFTNKTILRKKGKQTVKVTDTLNSGLTATVSISVV
jgi:uncharacterized repeat protein (TIGR03803 family)